MNTMSTRLLTERRCYAEEALAGAELIKEFVLGIMNYGMQLSS